MEKLRIATRESVLAMWQATHVQKRLQEKIPGLLVELIPMTTVGDQLLETRLDKVGGKGLFVKELETALLNGSADIAVHSMKDVPVEQPAGLCLPVILTREDARDVLVARDPMTIDSLPAHSIVGTSSIRRESQLKIIRPDLQIELLRGNVLTRLAKLDKGQYDAIILAAAGLNRLDLSTRISAFIQIETMLPAAGQGAIGIECRIDDAATRAKIHLLHDSTTADCVEAERAFNRALADVLPAAHSICHVPIAAFAVWKERHLHLTAKVMARDGSRFLEKSLYDELLSPVELGKALADIMLSHGALDILL